MGLFKRKKDEEVKIQLEREALDKLNKNDIELFEIPDDSTTSNYISSDWQISGKIKAPHTITADELNANTKKANDVPAKDNIAEEIPMTEKNQVIEDSPSNFLYQKMMQSRAKLSENSIESSTNEDSPKDEISDEIQIPASAPSKPLDITAAIDDLKNMVNSSKKTEAADNNTYDTVPEIDTVEDDIDSKTFENDIRENSIELNIEENVISEINDHKENIPEDVVDKQEDITINNDTSSENKDSHNNGSIEEEKVPVSQTEEISSVKTDSNDDITNMGSNAEERRATLLARCNAFLEDDSGPIKANVEKYKLESVESILKGFEIRAAERASKKFSTDQSLFTTHTNTTKTQKSEPDNKPEEIIDSTIIFEKISTDDKSTNNAPAPTTITNSNQVKHLFTADVNPKKENVEMEDISSTRIISSINKKSEKPTPNHQFEKTSVFPIVEPIVDASKSNEIISNSNNTVQNEKEEEKNNFDDYTGVADRQKIFNSLVRNKKTFTLKSILSFFALVVAILTTIIPITKGLESTTINIIDLIVCIFLSATNFNVFSGVSTLFGKKVKTCLPAALSLMVATAFSVLNLTLKENFIGFSSVVALTLFSYNYANKRFYSKTIKNFKLIADENTKNAVSIIQNKSATKTIVGKSIDGSALVCYGGKTTNIHNFLKYTYCKNPISDKIQKLSLVGIIVAFVLALASSVLNSANLISAFYIFTAALCFTSIPSTFHIVSLTINSANKRLNHYDAMITGYRAADELELCNGIAIGSDSLFPDGTIRLVDMKLLSPNPFDQSMLDAAAIATAIHSPLAGIFKQMDTSKIHNIPEQEVDSVIYEEKMGISGWVSDRRVFVGNRDLLIAHGFTGLPPAELDKKIMRKGYFPVYIASDNILCALLIVKYEPDENIIYEIQRLANTGTTILVDNCDPNINEKMLIDYFKVYSETIFVMSKQGADYYKALISHKDHRHAGAAYKSRIEGLLATLTASINIKKYISRMTAFYIISVVIGLLALITCIFTSCVKFITPTSILILHLIISTIMLLPAILRKP